MTRSPRLLLVASLLCAACPPAQQTAPVATTRGEPGAPTVTTPTTVTTTPAPPPGPLPAPPSLEGAPPVPAIELLTPAADCPPLPALPTDAPASQRALVPAITVLREASCRLDIFGMTAPAARRALHVPKDMSLEIGRRYARFAVPEKTLVRDVLAVLGVRHARVRLQQGWSSTWLIGAGELATELRPFGPGPFNLRVRGERNDDTPNGTLADIPPDAVLDGYLTVTVPETAARFAADTFAAPVAVAALIALARDPTLLARAPQQTHALLTMLGERYTLHRFSVRSGPEARVGLSLRPHRTELRADELAAGLALERPEHVAIHITDTNPDRLADKGNAEFPWHGLELEIELDERPEGRTILSGLAGWVVTSIQILPAPRP